MKNTKKWYDYLWIASSLYLVLGFFNIMFGWLGMLCFIIPLCIAIFGGSKHYCNRYCGRGQLFNVLGNKLKLSRKHDIPAFIKSPWFRYGFLTFFMTMFIIMLYNTYTVFIGSSGLRQVVKLFWTFKVPWKWAYHHEGFPLWTVQFAYGFYSMMLTSTLLGIITMVLYKPRSWCVYCPMGTMTQGICKLKGSHK